MVKAAARGAVDFANADMRDRWWWRRTRWILQDLEREAEQQALTAQHIHWITSFANARLDDNSFSVTQENARDALGSLMSAYFPWRREEFESAAKAGTMEQALEDYREEFGYPGDPRYEAMLQETLDAFKALEDGDWDDDEDFE